jgi:translation initiation factor IF-1
MKKKKKYGSPGKEEKEKIIHEKKKKKNGSPNNEKDIKEGTIVDPIKDIMFHVRLDNSDQIVLGYLSGKIRRNRIRVLLGDRVKILLTDYDKERGRIFYRFPPPSKKSRSREKRQSPESKETTKESTNPKEDSKDTTPNQD